MCFVSISEQTAIISLYSIKWLIFITERDCVYCAVRAEYLNVDKVNFQKGNLSSAMRLTNRTHFTILDFIILKIFDKEY
jgi:hypothetical protein